MNNKLIIFDLDGTLAHTAPDLIGTLNRITKQHELKPMEMNEFGQVIGHGAKAMIGRAFAINDQPLSEALLESLFEDFLKDYSANIANETKLFENLLPAMQDLSAKGCKFAVCTNKTEEMARLLLEKLSMSQHFEAMTGGNTFKFRKPDARHLMETARLAGYDISSAIMIGDSATDINAALNAGIPSVAVTFGYSDKPVTSLGASRVINNFNELYAAIESILQESASAG